MLNKKIFSVGGMIAIPLTALLLIFIIEIPNETTIQIDRLPTQLGGGFPPPTKLSDVDIGNEIPPFITSKVEGLNGQSKKEVNSEYSKYKEILILDDYKRLHVFVDDKGHKDVILGKIPVTPQLTDVEILYSENYIWITINPHRDYNIAGDFYTNLPLNEGYRFIDINENVKYAPVKGMTQMIDFDGNKIVITPLDLWFVTENLSYTIRGHITESQAIELANKILTIEQ